MATVNVQSSRHYCDAKALLSLSQPSFRDNSINFAEKLGKVYETIYHSNHLGSLLCVL